MSEAFRKLDERPVFSGHVISVAVGRFVAPGGEVFERDLVHHPGAVSVVPLLDDGSVVFVRQYRAALDSWLLEIPAGKRDVAGEAPEATAARELEEEVGFVATELELLAEFHNSAGFSDERSWVYLGTGLGDGSRDLQGLEERSLLIERYPLSDVPAMIAAGELTDAKSIIGCLLALRRWEG